jgi:hypothetical protein
MPTHWMNRTIIFSVAALVAACDRDTSSAPTAATPSQPELLAAKGGTEPHSAHWYNKDAAPPGAFSVILNLLDGTGAIVAVAKEHDVSTTIAGIRTDLSFQRKVLTCSPPACWPPIVLLGIDKDRDGRYEAKDFEWQWSLTSTPNPALLGDDTFLQCEAQAPATPDPDWTPVDVYATYACYHPNATGTGYDDYFLLSAYQAGAGSPEIMPDDIVLALKVLVGGSGNWLNFSALVDLVTMGGDDVTKTGGSTRIDEPNNSQSHFEVNTR